MGKSDDVHMLYLTVDGELIELNSFDEIYSLAKKLPPMTDHEREQQRRSFAFGNLNCSTNHKTTREAVDKAAAKSSLCPCEICVPKEID